MNLPWLMKGVVHRDVFMQMFVSVLMCVGVRCEPPSLNPNV